jgi:hypothetical protein
MLVQDHCGGESILVSIATVSTFSLSTKPVSSVFADIDCDIHSTVRIFQFSPLRSFIVIVCQKVFAFPKARGHLSLADAAAIKVEKNSYRLPSYFNTHLRSQEVTLSRARFPKPVKAYKVLTVFGGNIVASEGEEWKRYRKVAAPAFSDVSQLS